MENKRYVIIKTKDIDVCPICPVIAQSCNNCKIKKDYGDTKKQFIKKIAQILFKEKIKNFINLFGEEYLNKRWKQIYSKEATREATKIVNFLGVE